MGIVTAPPSLVSHYNSVNQQSWTNSMSQDYHQGIFNFSNGFERSQQDQDQQQQHHVAQQIRRDKLRVQGFEPPPPLVGIDEEESAGIQGYETAGMLSEMFNFPPGAAGTATELLENQILQSYRNSRAPAAGGAGVDWFPQRQGMAVGSNLGNSKNQAVLNEHHHQNQQQQHQISSINADPAAAMQLFLINPQQQQQQRSSSPSPPHPAQTPASTLHMLLPNSASSSSILQALPVGGHFGQFTWIPNSTCESNPNEIPSAVVEGQGLSLSLSSSLPHLEEAKAADELRIGEGGMLFFGQGTAGASSAAVSPLQYHFKNLSGGGGGGLSHNHPFVSSFGSANMLRNSKYAKAAQELLEEFCSVGRGQFKKIKSSQQNNNNSSGGNPISNPGSGCAGNSSSSSKDIPALSAADRIEHQRRKVKLLSMLEEVETRYGHYCEQMQMVVNSFDMVMGFSAAVPYTCLAQKAMSRHFRCLKDAIAEQLKRSCEALGEKDVGSSGVTKGETPRLRMLEQSLRQQRAFHQMGMMEQEAWRPQRGLPERSVNILRAWLFEHFLHPYPSDADKHLLARQTGLSRNQVSNWFINARVRLWKPMIEEMYQQEAKDEPGEDDDQGQGQGQDHSSSSPHTLNHPATSSDMINAGVPETDQSQTATFDAINRQCFPENQAAARLLQHGGSGVSSLQPPPAAAMPDDPANIEAAPTLIRFGTSAGDVSLTLGLRHAGNLPEKSPFSVRDFGGC